MNVFNLFSKITLDKSDYVNNLKSASALTKQETEKIRNSFLEMQNANKLALSNLQKDFANGKISLSQYNGSLSEIEKSQSEIEKSASSMGISLEKSAGKAALGWLAVAAAIAKAVQTLVKLATESMNYADQIGDLANKYGVTTDAISEMQYIADQSSTSIEGLTSSMTMLYNRAKQDGEAFQRLGVSVKDSNGNFKTMDELFWETIGAMNDIQNEGEKSAVMLDLFGRSAMSVGEVVRKSSDEIARMRQEAHDLGIVLNAETIQYASDFNDTMARLKLQGQSALASLVAGAPDAEERLQNFFDNVMEMLENYAPAFVNFFVRLLWQTSIALMKLAPQLAIEIISAVIDTIVNIDWIQVGIDIGKSILEGLANILISGLNAILGIFGIEIPKVSFNSGEKSDYFNVDTGEEYEISENIKQDITVRVEASGDSTVSQETAEKTAEALAPYIDKILGNK